MRQALVVPVQMWAGGEPIHLRAGDEPDERLVLLQLYLRVLAPTAALLTYRPCCLVGTPCVCVCVCVCVFVSERVCVRVFVCVCQTNTHTHARGASAHTHTHTDTQTDTGTGTDPDPHTHARAYTHTSLHAHTRTHTRTLRPWGPRGLGPFRFAHACFIGLRASGCRAYLRVTEALGRRKEDQQPALQRIAAQMWAGRAH
jgi:hypothetical protein